MAEDFPDFTHAVRLLGVDADGDLVTVLLDSAGNMGAILKGTTAAEDLLPVKVDDAGQLYAILRGADSVDVAVDASGFLSALVKGVDGGAVLRTLAVDTSGRLIMIPRGQSGYYLDVNSLGYLTAVLKGETATPALKSVRVDDDGQIIMVPRGQSGYYMAVDANGYMTAVLKGAHDSVLTTIGVDADGRIDAFLMDGSDQWGQKLRVGNADLVGRLGSPVTWDWRGNVYYIHDFGTGIPPCFTSATGTGSAVAITPERGGYGGYTLKLTSGDAEGNMAQVQLPVGINPGTRVGVAARFSIYSNTAYVRLMLERWKSANPPVGYARINVASKTVEVYDNSPQWRSLGSVPTSLGSYTFSWFKLVIDQATGKYERVLYNDTYYDASAYTCPDSAIAVEGVAAVSFRNEGRASNNDVVYLDQLVITVNEPANPS